MGDHALFLFEGREKYNAENAEKWVMEKTLGNRGT